MKKSQIKTFLLIRVRDNKINLYLGLIASHKIEITPYDGVLTSVYCFNVEETIKQYRKTFKNNIYIND